MSTTLISPMIVKVEPDELDANDILEFAEALIEEDGHHVGSSGSSASAGWTIHDAVGEAAKRATGESGKDGARSRLLRNEAQEKVETTTGKTEFAANDEAGGMQGALEIIRNARGAA